MKIIKLTIILVLLTFSKSYAQNDALYKLWPDSILAEANAAANVGYMTEEEQKVVYYTNLVRINPPLFAKTYFTQYLKDSKTKKDKDVRSLLKELESSGKLTIVKPSKALTETAREHAKDMGEVGKTGHNSSDGKSFKERMEEHSTIYDGINENCNYGFESGIDAFMDLLIDRNVPNYGHRRNILDPEMKFIGVAIEPHKRYGHNCVQDLGGAKL